MRSASIAEAATSSDTQLFKLLRLASDTGDLTVLMSGKSKASCEGEGRLFMSGVTAIRNSAMYAQRAYVGVKIIENMDVSPMKLISNGKNRMMEEGGRAFNDEERSFFLH